ncbi:TPA: hypothetical protein ACNCFH_002562, partial [Escherichia coli]
RDDGCAGGGNGQKTLNARTGLRFEFARNRRADKAFTPHLATNALPDIKVPENISGIFIPQPNS